jgi:hypothetical protein
MSKAGSTFSFHEDDLDFMQNYNKVLQNLILRDTPPTNKEGIAISEDYQEK